MFSCCCNVFIQNTGSSYLICRHQGLFKIIRLRSRQKSSPRKVYQILKDWSRGLRESTQIRYRIFLFLLREKNLLIGSCSCSQVFSCSADQRTWFCMHTLQDGERNLTCLRCFHFIYNHWHVAKERDDFTYQTYSLYSLSATCAAARNVTG